MYLNILKSLQIVTAGNCAGDSIILSTLTLTGYWKNNINETALSTNRIV